MEQFKLLTMLPYPYNYMLAVCDAHYRSIMVEIGDAGCHSDGEYPHKF